MRTVFWRIDDTHVVTSDKLQYVLNRVKVNEDTGEETLFPVSFYGNLKQLVRGLIEREVMDSEQQHEDVQSIVSAIDNATEKVFRAISASMVVLNEGEAS